MESQNILKTDPKKQYKTRNFNFSYKRMKMMTKAIQMSNYFDQCEWGKQCIQIKKVNVSTYNTLQTVSFFYFFLYYWNQDSFTFHEIRPQKSYRSVRKHLLSQKNATFMVSDSFNAINIFHRTDKFYPLYPSSSGVLLFQNI